MSDRHVPVRPNLRQLKRQAKDLLRAVHRNEPDAVAEFRRNHPGSIDPAAAKLADAQFALARAYGVASWPRLVQACEMTNAICKNDIATVRKLVLDHPALLHEDARGVKGNWGPPMSYAANLGRDRIITMLRELGAQDLQYAFERACLQGQVKTARMLHDFGARPNDGSVMGPCETLSPDGLALLLELGARVVDDRGDPLAPIGLLLETYGRHPDGKHKCLEILAARGVALPDTPPMAVHRGRIDLLERLFEREPSFVARTYSIREIYPLELGCHEDATLALHGTPLDGATLLHMAIDFDEMAVFKWLLAHGADINGKAAVDADGFGGHSPLFSTVIVQSQEARESDAYARRLLDHGADPNARASLRKRMRFVGDEQMYAFRDVTPLGWGDRFQEQDWVCKPAMKLIEKRGGQR